MYSIGAELKDVELEKLRPTQITVGFKEVDKKRRSWTKLRPKDRREAMRRLSGRQGSRRRPTTSWTTITRLPPLCGRNPNAFWWVW